VAKPRRKMKKKMATNRYNSQIVLPEIGEDGQRKLGAARVLCVGAGGLGCPALFYLAAAGVGHLGIVDFDRVEIGNLQRQILFTTDQEGQNKAEAARDRLAALNPEIRITAYPVELTDKNAEELFADYDLVIDATDSFAAKYLINDAALKCGRPVIYGAISGFEGQAAVFGYKGGPCYRCLYPHPPDSYVPNCAESGVIGAVAGMTGLQQALQALQLIVAAPEFRPLSGKFWLADLRCGETRIFDLPKNPECPACAAPQEITLSYASPVCGAATEEITAEQAAALCGTAEAVFIDVRETAERRGGSIENDRHCALSLLKTQGVPEDLPRGCKIILYCRSGRRSITAAQIFRAAGYLDTVSLAGGFAEWQKVI